MFLFKKEKPNSHKKPDIIKKIIIEKRILCKLLIAYFLRKKSIAKNNMIPKKQ